MRNTIWPIIAVLTIAFIVEGFSTRWRTDTTRHIILGKTDIKTVVVDDSLHIWAVTNWKYSSSFDTPDGLIAVKLVDHYVTTDAPLPNPLISQAINTWPNPFGSEVSIHTIDGGLAKIIDAHGKEVMRFDLAPGLVTKQLVLPSGVYWLLVLQLHKKMVVIR